MVVNSGLRECEFPKNTHTNPKEGYLKFQVATHLSKAKIFQLKGSLNQSWRDFQFTKNFQIILYYSVYN